jgi:RsiW-degrading membrane proteinase PrsW (M82 family)
MRRRLKKEEEMGVNVLAEFVLSSLEALVKQIVVFVAIWFMSPICTVLALVATTPEFWIFYKLTHKKHVVNCTKKQLVIGIFLGVICVALCGDIPSISPLNPFTDESITYYICNALLSAALPEECLKLLILVILTKRYRTTLNQYNFMCYAASIAIGFSLLENLTYISNSDSLWITFIVRMIPGHLSYSLIMGWFYGLSRQNVNERKYWKGAGYFGLSLLMPILAHTIFNSLPTIVKNTTRVHFNIFIWAAVVLTTIILTVTIPLIIGLRLAKKAEMLAGAEHKATEVNYSAIELPSMM